MNDNTRLVWSDEQGDLRKKNKSTSSNSVVDESLIELLLKRLTSGKGRTVIEITGLPNNKSWCKKLAKDLKKSLGVGGAYKNDFIEIHGEKLDDVKEVLSNKNLKFKQTGS